MKAKCVRASHVLSARDLKMRADENIADIISRFLVTAEGVVAHWVQFGKGALLFVMAPDDDRSGAFYIYDRRLGSFWLLDLADGVFGGYTQREMRRKIHDFRLLDFAQNPATLIPVA
jgi:hypothetical protein